MGVNTETYQIGFWLFLQGLALCFFLAFLSLLTQLGTLFGRDGILSIDIFLGALEREPGFSKYYQVPSLFWLSSHDLTLWLAVLAGLTVSTLAFIGVAPGLMLFIAWLLYLSFVSTGQDFMGYQWDGLLLELGFVTSLFLPWSLDGFGARTFPNLTTDSQIYLVLFWLILFKLLFGSGLSKLLSKEKSWRELSALNFHFWTQPLPNAGAYFMHQLPANIKKVITALVLAVEILVPFMFFASAEYKLIAAVIILIFQLFIFVTGNFTFFNILTSALTLTLVADTYWQDFTWLNAIQPEFVALNTSGWLLFVTVAMISIHLFWINFTISEKFVWNKLFIPVARILYYLRLNNHYSLFSTMTRERYELILEGSRDGEHWQEYQFRYKPDSLTKPLKQVAPHQPRVDWQLWFAALGHFHQNLWMQNLVVQIFWQSPEVLRIFAHNPFGEEAPQFLRWQKYSYSFAAKNTDTHSRQIWERQWLSTYSPIFNRDDFSE
ncbi:MAG: lipase maturation factor family protein [Bdellovibrionia bacterium]